MKALIILNGELKSPEFLNKLSRQADFIICADGGYDKAKSSDVVPDVLIGDMDSVEHNDFSGETYTYPCEKDETDCELAIRFATERGADEIVLTCALGGRFDHALSNLSLLLNNPSTVISEPDCDVFCCKTCEIMGKKGKTFSLIPFTDTIASMSGVKYSVDKAVFKTGTSLGVSNEITKEVAIITLHEGKALIFINK